MSRKFKTKINNITKISGTKIHEKLKTINESKLSPEYVKSIGIKNLTFFSHALKITQEKGGSLSTEIV